MWPDTEGEYLEANVHDKDLYDESDFQLKVDDMPSAKCRSWKYCWRGSGTFEGNVLHPKGKVGFMTFGGAYGTQLSGWFDSDQTGRVEFTGLKTGPVSNSPPPEWELASYKWKEQAVEEESNA